jgi:acetyltransferase-like isoleucine patch superfamily enzyme
VAWVRQRLRKAIADAGARARVLRESRGDVTLGHGVQIAPRARLLNRYGGAIRLGAGVRIDYGALLISQEGDITIAHDCYVGPYSILYGSGGLRIGTGTMIAGHTMIIPADHKHDDPDVPMNEQGMSRQGVTIGEHVWIAAHVVVLDGVTIGDHALVGAGAVVTKDVEPHARVGGVPARELRSRTGAAG